MAERFVDITGEEPDGHGKTSWVRRWFTGAPRWLFGALAGANALLTLAVYAVPGTYFYGWMVAFATWLVLGLAWLVRLGLTMAVGGGWAGLRPRRIAWLLAPTIVVITGGLVMTGAPLWLGLQIAKPAMIAYAQNASASPPERVGFYGVFNADRFPGAPGST